MRGHWVLLAIAVGAAPSAWAATETQPPSGAARPQQPNGQQPGEQEGVIDPKADAALRRMSDHLGKLRTFRVEATTIDEKVTTDGQKIQEVQESQLTVRRPNALRVERVSPAGHGLLVYDGRQFGLSNRDKHVYAVTQAPPTIADAVDDVRARLHVDAPAGDLIVPNSYAALLDGTIAGHYIGLEPIGGVMAHHIAVTKKDTDFQIWIKDGPDAVPLRFVITTKDQPSQPQFTAELRNWQENPSVPASTFSFTTPPGAKRISPTETQQQGQQGMQGMQPQREEQR